MLPVAPLVMRSSVWALSLLMLLHSPLPARAATALLIDGGFQYQLANPSITDITGIDYAGDDCAELPCPAFPLPPSCVVAPSVPATFPATGYGWSAPFLATAAGLTPTSPLIPYTYMPDLSWLVESNGTDVWLTDSGWGARILLRCGIPCPAGTYLVGYYSSCLPCPVGTWSAAGVNATSCRTCTNGPLNSVYTSTSATSAACPFTCPAGTYAKQSYHSSTLLVSTGATLQALHPGVGTGSTIISSLPGAITCIEAAGSLGQIYLATSTTIYRMGMEPYLAPAIVATGFVFLTSIRLYRNDTILLAMDQGACKLQFVYLTSPVFITNIAGGSCGFADSPTGMAARFNFPYDLAVDEDAKVAYVADEYNYRVRVVSLVAPYPVMTLAGNGVGGQFDGVGVGATIDPFYLALSTATNTLYVRCPGLIRRIDLASRQVTTITYGIQSNAVGMALGPLSGQLFYAALTTSGAVSVSSMLLGSYTSVPLRTVYASTVPIRWASLVVINETWTPDSPSPPVCAACIACFAGRYSVCNTSYSACLPCPAGTLSASGTTTCTPCPAGTFSPAPGASTCLNCPYRTFVSGSGSTTCYPCLNNTYTSTQRSTTCALCAPGTFADPIMTMGASACQACPALPYLAKWDTASPALTCPFVCPSGTTFNGTACGGCDVGTWASPTTSPSASSSSTTTAVSCAPCTNLPGNATYTGVGASPTTCAYRCNTGFIAANTFGCAPCPPGTHYYITGAACVPCYAGSYSPREASLACLACPTGTYSISGSTACTRCQGAGNNINNYTVFIGRGTSATCAFYCKPGSMLNRNASPPPASPSCAQCAAGTYTSAPSSTACTACAGGTWSAPGATACAACNPPPSPNYYY